MKKAFARPSALEQSSSVFREDANHIAPRHRSQTERDAINVAGCRRLSLLARYVMITNDEKQMDRMHPKSNASKATEVILS